MAGLVRSVVFDIIGRDNASRAFLSASKNAEIAATRFDRSMYRMEARAVRFQHIGRTLSTAITLPVAAAAAFSIDQAAKFQKSMTVLQTATGELHGNMKLVSTGIENIAEQTGTTLGQLSDGMYLVEKAGYRGGKGLDVLRVAAKGAKAENVDLGIATQALTSIMKSYQLGAGQATAAENALIRGSGLAKATMTDFAGSLSNVVPLAASLGIKLPEILAAVATMTQHGETAQRATENLSNLVTNLAGQNNVASLAMQQLGINTVNLQRHLGSRGLLGTLNVVLKAMRDHSHGGMIVYSALKQAALGAVSLRSEIDHMTGALKTNSIAFRDGKMSFTDYRKFYKSLGGDAAIAGQNFLATMQKVKGFNDLLKSGRGNVQTAANALKTMAGGVTGMRTVLMLLGGEFIKNNKGVSQFRATTESINKAMNSDNGVLGWGKIAKTASVQWDKLKAQIQVTAVKIGTVLLPIGLKLVHWVRDVIDWFTRLSPWQKKFLGWAIAVGALLGPVIAILSRLTRGFAILFRVGAAIGRFQMGMRGMQLSMDSMGTSAYQNGARVNRALGSTGIAASETATKVASAEARQTEAVAANAAEQIAAIERVRAAMGAPIMPMGVGPSMGVPPRGAAPTRFGGLKAGAATVGGFGLGIGAVYASSKIPGSNSLAGAGYGAMIGSFAGPAGMIAGAFIGGLIGGITGKDDGWKHIIQPANTPIGRHNAQFGTFADSNGSLKLGGVRVVMDMTAMHTKALANALKIAGREQHVLNQVSDQYGQISRRNAKNIVETALKLAGLTDYAKKFGVSSNEMATAISGTSDQYGRLRKLLADQGANTAALKALDALRNGFIHGTGSAKVYQTRIGQLKTQIDKLKTGMDLGTLKMSSAAAAAQIASLAGQIAYVQGLLNALNGTSITWQGAGGPVAPTTPIAGQRGQLGSGTPIPGYTPPASATIHVHHPTVGGNPVGNPAGGGGGGGGGGGSGNTKHDKANTAIGTFLSAINNMSESAKQFRKAIDSFRAVAKKLGAHLSHEQTATLMRLAHERDRITDKLLPRAETHLANLRQARSSLVSGTRSAFTGSVDITSLGQDSWGVASASGIVTSIQKMARDAVKFARLVKRLAKEGLPRPLVEQLALAGPAALPAAEALISATPKQLNQIKSAYSQITSSGKGLSNYLGDHFYKAGIHSAEKLVQGLKDRRSLLTKAIRGLGDELVHEVERDLGMKQTRFGHHRYGGGERALEQHFHIQGITDPEAFALIVARRLAQMVA